jgi:hypothetical protein
LFQAKLALGDKMERRAENVSGLKPDTLGTLNGATSKKHGYWGGIPDRSKDPAYTWRHRFEDQARRAGVLQNMTDGLMRHLNAMNESEGYGRGLGLKPDATALDKMASPFQAPIAGHYAGFSPLHSRVGGGVSRHP